MSLPLFRHRSRSSSRPNFLAKFLAVSHGDRMIRLLAFVAALVFTAPALAQRRCPPISTGRTPSSSIRPKGASWCRLRPDLAPKHVERIKLLTKDGYYNNAPFHRVISGFMAQTGDGARGDGTGSSKYRTCRPNSRRRPTSAASSAWRARPRRTRRTRSSSSCTTTIPRSTASTPWSARWCRAWRSSTSSSAASRWPNPDRMVRVQLATDVK